MTTITREQLRELSGGKLTDDELAKIAAHFGYTIAEPEPPEAMVKLAREIVDRLLDECLVTPEQAALAALQHADKIVVRHMFANETRDEIRRAFGAIA